MHGLLNFNQNFVFFDITTYSSVSSTNLEKKYRYFKNVKMNITQNHSRNSRKNINSTTCRIFIGVYINWARISHIAIYALQINDRFKLGNFYLMAPSKSWIYQKALLEKTSTKLLINFDFHVCRMPQT